MAARSSSCSSAIGATEPSTVVDLGCGPGNLTGLLARRWPGATVTGLDSSPEMVEAARAAEPGLAFEVADLRDWAAGGDPVDVLVSNATLQWVPGHLELLPALVSRVRPGGWFAFQVPGNFDEPSHTIRAELAAEAPYAEHVAGVAVPASHDPATYLDALAGLGCTVDAWETTYSHVLTGPDPVFTWVTGTGARPTLQALPGRAAGAVRGGVPRAARGGVPRPRLRRGAAVPPDLRRRAPGSPAGPPPA